MAHRQPDVTCYLCGGPLAGTDTNEDHVPTQKIIPTSLRNRHQWVKPTVHQQCNGAFSRDEEYFKIRIWRMAHQTPAAEELAREVFKNGRKTNRQLEELAADISDRTPAGLVSPWGQVMRYRGTRTDRVLWKLSRGCLYLANNEILPTRPREGRAGLRTYSQFGDMVRMNPPLLDRLLRTSPVVDIKGAFSARILRGRRNETALTSCWMHFLGSVWGLVVFHDVTCECAPCVTSRSDPA